MMPNRHAEIRPWWDNPVVHAPFDGDDFRRPMPGADWAGPLGPGDPRLTPAGDIARRGTIPEYVTYAVQHPGNITTTVQ
jgi:hypothetical protein